MASLVLLVALPSAVLIRRSRAGRGGAGQVQPGAPRDPAREALEARRDWEASGGSGGG